MMIRAALFSILLLGGCGVISLNEQEDLSPVADVQPSYDFQDTYMIKAYETAATRATNKMLDDTADIYEVVPKPKLYIKDIVKNSPNLPDGFHTARRAIKEIAGKSGTYVVVKDMNVTKHQIPKDLNIFPLYHLNAPQSQTLKLIRRRDRYQPVYTQYFTDLLTEYHQALESVSIKRKA